MMTVEEIQKMVNRKSSLTLEEKQTLADAMLENPEAKKIVIAGFLAQGNYGVATELMFSK